MNITKQIRKAILPVIPITLIVCYCIFINENRCPLLTPDTKGYLLFNNKEYTEASETFHNPLWQGVALYRAGEFKQAAAVFSGYDTAKGFYNYGNALLMQGQYEKAIDCYKKALDLNPEWNDAKVNHAIAINRAAKLKKEGGNMTDGKLGADDFIFEKNKNKSQEQQTEIIEQNSAAARELWLRQVQTKPADFLKSKFSYQIRKEISQ